MLPEISKLASNLIRGELGVPEPEWYGAEVGLGFGPEVAKLVWSHVRIEVRLRWMRSAALRTGTAL